MFLLHMLTSLRTNDTTSYFYFGETLQHTTDSHYSQTFMSSFDNSDAIACIRASPVMITAFFT